MLTDAHYFVKNRGNAHFAVTLPEGTVADHGAFGQRQTKVRVATALDEMADIGEDLAFLGNVRLERGAIHDLI